MTLLIRPGSKLSFVLIFHFSVHASLSSFQLPLPRSLYHIRLQNSSRLGTSSFAFLTYQTKVSSKLFVVQRICRYRICCDNLQSQFLFHFVDNISSAGLLSHETSVYRRRRRVADEGRKDTRQLNVFHVRLAVVSCVLHCFNSCRTENTRTPSTYNKFRSVLWANGDTDPSKS